MTERDEHLRIIAAAREIIGNNRSEKASGIAMPSGNLPERGKYPLDDDTLSELEALDRWLQDAEKAIAEGRA